MATEKGVIKKTNLSEFGNPRRDGIIAIKIEEGDRLIGVKMTEGNNEVVLTTRKGMSIRFKEAQVRDQGRATCGVRGIRLDKDDAVESLEIVNPSATFLVCTENGYGKRTEFAEYRCQGRGGRGVIAIRTSERNGMVVGAHSVLAADSLMLITEKGMMIKMPVNDIRVIGRATQGVRLINLEEGDKLVSATAVEPEDETVVDRAPDQPA
jgi:DNA gyrase subunit A